MVPLKKIQKSHSDNLFVFTPLLKMASFSHFCPPFFFKNYFYIFLTILLLSSEYQK